MQENMNNGGMKQSEPYLEKFEKFEREGKQPSWVFPLRKAGIARFAELGFPTVNDEDWRFTNVSPIARLPFRPMFQAQTEEVKTETINQFWFSGLKGHRLVFVNGHFAPALSTPLESDGIVVLPLSKAMTQYSALLEKHLGRYARGENNAFTSLNAAFFQDGAFIHIGANKQLADPVQILYISTATDSGSAAHPRNLILADAKSRCTLVESFVSLVDAPYFTNVVTELVAGEGAMVEHCKFQDESAKAFHISALHADLGRRSNCIFHSIATGARLSRNNIRTGLNGEGLECVLNGLYLTRGDQLADHHMVVEHAQPHCNSHEYYNGILDDQSKGVFHGRILVRQAAQKTDAKQTNKNLLLSDEATVDTKPQLEIYADDVKCTHGATVGQLNEESIFYLRARGIGEETARRMLIHAFAGEIIERIKLPALREELDKLVWDRLEANPLVGASQ